MTETKTAGRFTVQKLEERVAPCHFVAPVCGSGGGYGGGGNCGGGGGYGGGGYGGGSSCGGGYGGGNSCGFLGGLLSSLFCWL